jgi:hypothetical protein
MESEPDDTPIAFENLGVPRLAELAKNRKSNAWMSTHMHKGPTIACRHALAWPRELPASTLLAGQRATAAKLEALEPRAFGEIGCRHDERESVTKEGWP